MPYLVHWFKSWSGTQRKLAGADVDRPPLGQTRRTRTPIAARGVLLFYRYRYQTVRRVMVVPQPWNMTADYTSPMPTLRPDTGKSKWHRMPICQPKTSSLLGTTDIRYHLRTIHKFKPSSTTKIHENFSLTNLQITRDRHRWAKSKIIGGKLDRERRTRQPSNINIIRLSVPTSNKRYDKQNPWCLYAYRTGSGRR